MSEKDATGDEGEIRDLPDKRVPDSAADGVKGGTPAVSNPVPSAYPTPKPISPRSTCGARVGRWNCCSPTLTHIFSVPTIIYGSRVSPSVWT